MDAVGSGAAAADPYPRESRDQEELSPTQALAVSRALSKKRASSAKRSSRLRRPLGVDRTRGVAEDPSAADASRREALRASLSRALSLPKASAYASHRVRTIRRALALLDKPASDAREADLSSLLASLNL
mmetsp:Transcript_61188/g.193834  ORF Transcript_61188/g.193834 Transcript_61188/m.193834 type:complete len:130 (+) Transcript_61188:170-559(+)